MIPKRMITNTIVSTLASFVTGLIIKTLMDGTVINTEFLHISLFIMIGIPIGGIVAQLRKSEGGLRYNNTDALRVSTAGGILMASLIFISFTVLVLV